MKNSGKYASLQSVVFVAALLLCACVVGQAQTCQVETDGGTVAGVLADSTCVYKGIPYAASPAGAGRWRPPAPVVPWSGVRSAANYGSMCPQLASGVVVGDEDCLNLNVWVPDHPNQPLPVMVYIHGGGAIGSSRSVAGTSHDGQFIAEHGPVVAVTIQFRLGALGTLATPSLDAESSTNTSGNYFVLDQIAALKWVQRNIGAFGGDPNNVTIFGESSGAAGVGALVASPLATGLFSNALMESANGLGLDQRSMADYEATNGVDILTKVGCVNATNIPDCLRNVPSTTLVKNIAGVNPLFSGSPFVGLVDGFVLNDTTYQTIKEGAHNRVPLVIGNNTDETAGGGFTPLSFPDDAFYRTSVIGLLGQPTADQALELYPSANYPTPRDAYIALTTDYRFLCPNRRLARAFSKSQQEPVFRYIYSHVLDHGPGRPFRAFHTLELMWVFRSFFAPIAGAYTPTADELTLSDQIIGYWTRFAANGDPNGGGSLPWFVYGRNPGNEGNDSGAQGEEKKDTFLQLEIPLANGAGLHADVCESLWDPLAHDTNNGHGDSASLLTLTGHRSQARSFSYSAKRRHSAP